MLSLIVDTTKCPIQRPGCQQRVYYSGHTKQHSVKYELGIDFVDGALVWIAGPAPGSRHDLTILRCYGLLRNLKKHECILADRAYVGEWRVVTPLRRPRTAQEYQVNHVLSSLREEVEHAFGYFKHFRVLNTPFRHPLVLHPMVFYVVAQIVNLEIILK